MKWNRNYTKFSIAAGIVMAIGGHFYFSGLNFKTEAPMRKYLGALSKVVPIEKSVNKNNEVPTAGSKKSKSDRSPANERTGGMVQTITPNLVLRPKTLKKVSPYKRSKTKIEIPKWNANSDEYDFENNGLKFRKLENIFALKEEDFPGGVYEIIEKKFGYVIFKALPGSFPNALPVVNPEGSSSVAIFTGILKVKLNDFQEVDSIIDSVPYEVTQRYDHINSAFYKFYSYEETMQIYSKLKNDSRIQNVNIELLEYQRQAR